MMKVKVIKKAELESLADQQQQNATKTPRRQRIKSAVEKWVAEIRERSEAETHVALEHLLHPDSEQST